MLLACLLLVSNRPHKGNYPTHERPAGEYVKQYDAKDVFGMPRDGDYRRDEIDRGGRENQQHLQRAYSVRHAWPPLGIP